MFLATRKILSFLIEFHSNIFSRVYELSIIVFSSFDHCCPWVLFLCPLNRKKKNICHYICTHYIQAGDYPGQYIFRYLVLLLIYYSLNDHFKYIDCVFGLYERKTTHSFALINYKNNIKSFIISSTQKQRKKK